MRINFSFIRLWAIMLKEFLQVRRDKATFAMLVGIPLIQLVLFGYAINSNPKHLPSMILSQDHSVFTRSFIASMKNTDYFHFTQAIQSEQQAKTALAENKAQFVVNIPANFSHDLIRGLKPTILVQADATDPSATANAVSALNVLATHALNRNLVGPLKHLQASPQPFNIVVHALYNPLGVTQYNIVPGLLGVVLTMTLVIITALAITRERERGTMENLLATPARPLEVMIGKIIPYIVIGYIQVILILIAAKLLFHIPFMGSLVLLLVSCFPFIAANLAVGLMFSTLAKNQLQAIQAAFFFFLPSILLSGFMFPFRGMPVWAQYIGQVLPLTHFLVIVRGIILKGNDFMQIWPAMWPLLIFAFVVLVFTLKRYHQTLD